VSAIRRANPLIVWGLCLLCGLAVGVSGFSSDSNHPTYLPPSLHNLDPQFLAQDWWMQSASHYHYAFFVLAALLAKLNVLEAGLALLNVMIVAAATFACFKIIEWFRLKNPVPALAICIALFLVTRSFFTIGSAYIFTPSLQPSSIAAAATLAAIASFLNRRMLHCGLWLGLSGLFHINFLVANLPFFGLAFLLAQQQFRPLQRHLLKENSIGLLKLLGPSLILLAAFAPLILSVSNDVLSPAAKVQADWVLFRFAVPFHYYPLGFLPTLIPFVLWQALGLLWTQTAVPDPDRRRMIWALQIALALILWTATALTTFVFIAPVSRLFLWRLAPFAVLLAALIISVAGLRMLENGKSPESSTQGSSLRVIVTLFILYTLSMMPVGQLGQAFKFFALAPGPVILGGLFLGVMLNQRFGFSLPKGSATTTIALGGMLAFAIATQPSDGKDSRYSLLFPSQSMKEERELFGFVRQSTADSAQFLTPPDLDMFRLQTGRAIIADIKAVPLNRSGLIEWYSRLEDVSGLSHPKGDFGLEAGFESMDTARLERLRCKYHVGFTVLRTRQPLAPAGWAEVFRNPSFRVLKYLGKQTCKS
jgi:hypothetical protein